jgi:hypothetical protein
LVPRNTKLESLQAPAADLLSRLDFIASRSFVRCGA